MQLGPAIWVGQTQHYFDAYIPEAAQLSAPAPAATEVFCKPANIPSGSTEKH